ncbi:MAG: MFS transporter [Alphaproteobacteria bacterium]|nr:MAG: MFS transporter [Alphaproteobacteria bacterium]
MTASTAPANPNYGVFSLPVIVAALGYFVDIYDLLGFNVVRMTSLRDIGVAEADLFSVGISIVNTQLIGLLIGGLLFGVLGDKIGRTRLLFLSIIVYSGATLANAMVHDVTMYKLCRFVAGLGLAGELGLAMTLVSEVMAKEKRGYGTALVAGFGISGAVAAAIVAKYVDWRAFYAIGSIMGFLLLLLRMRVRESFIFLNQIQDDTRGSLKLMFSSTSRIKRVVLCMMLGAPVYFVVWFLAPFVPEISKALGAETQYPAGDAILYSALGLAAGDFIAGCACQWFRSRRKVIGVFMGAAFLLCGYFFLAPHSQTHLFYSVMLFAMGFAAGFFAVVVAIAAEIFGTNLRATAATSIPNFMRATFIAISTSVNYLRVDMGLIPAVTLVGAVTFILGFIAIYVIHESFGCDLNYREE